MINWDSVIYFIDCKKSEGINIIYGTTYLKNFYVTLPIKISLK